MTLELGDRFPGHPARAARASTQAATSHPDPLETFSSERAGTGAESGARHNVLMRELEHRNRNLIGLVRAIARQLMPLCASREEFAQRFDTRLEALARAESLLTGAVRGQVLLGDLVRLELEAVGAPPGRCRLSGEKVCLPSRMTQAMVLALHELATNAAKHGALSSRGGAITVRWRVAAREGERRLSLAWIENCTRPVVLAVEPTRRGFGRQLIEEALAYQFQARTALRIRPKGLHCMIELPL